MQKVKELQGVWKCDEMLPDAYAEDCCISVMLHIKNFREDGLARGYLVRSERYPGRARKVSLPVLIEVVDCNTLIRLKSLKHEMVDELCILLLNTDRLLLKSTVNNQSITFKKDGSYTGE
jgi:hypothetical protein